MAGARSAPRPIRLIHVGMGGWGRDWMRMTRVSPDVDTVAYVDPAASALAATEALGVPPERLFTSFDDALDATRPEAALITTRVERHADVALLAIAAGLDVLLEKPFAPSLDEAVRVVQAGDAAGRIVLVSQNYRHHPAPRVAARMIATGEVGTVGMVEVDFRRPGIRRLDYAQQHAAMTQPLLMDMAIHHFDLLRFILGREIAWIDCEGATPAWSIYRDPPTAYATIGVDGGTLVSYRGSWLSRGTATTWGGDWRLEAEAGEIAFTSRGDRVPDRLRFRPTGGRAKVVPLPEMSALDRAGTLAEFAVAVRDRVEPPTSGRDNLRTLAASLAAVRSVRDGRRVDLAELLRDLPEDLR